MAEEEAGKQNSDNNIITREKIEQGEVAGEGGETGFMYHYSTTLNVRPKTWNVNDKEKTF